MNNIILAATSPPPLKNEVVDAEDVIEEDDEKELGHHDQDLVSTSPSTNTISVTRHVNTQCAQIGSDLQYF